MPSKRKKYAKPLSMFPKSPLQALADILFIPPKEADCIRGISAAKLRAWRIPNKKKAK